MQVSSSADMGQGRDGSTRYLSKKIAIPHNLALQAARAEQHLSDLAS